MLWPAVFKKWVFKLRHSGIKSIFSPRLVPLEINSGFATTSMGV